MRGIQPQGQLEGDRWNQQQRRRRDARPQQTHQAGWQQIGAADRHRGPWCSDNAHGNQERQQSGGANDGQIRQRPRCWADQHLANAQERGACQQHARAGGG